MKRLTDYADYSVNDFIMDEYFRDSVLRPDTENTAFWREWLKLHPDKEADLEEASHLVRTIQFKPYPISPAQSANIWHNINKEISHEAGKQKVLTLKRNWMQWAAVFAGIIFLSGATYLMFLKKRHVTYLTANNETKDIRLPDGSMVKLNANSSLVLASDWSGEKPREVWLKGEAFFKVNHLNRDLEHIKAGEHFFVHTGNLNVEVLGTQFDVHNRRGDTRVMLKCGKVKLDIPVSGSVKEVMMAPGEMAELSGNLHKVIKKKVNPRNYLSWIKGIIKFEDTSLQNITTVLEDTYGLKVTIDPGLKNMKFTGELNTGRLDVFLSVLAKAFDITVTKTSSELIMKKNQLTI